MNKVRKFCIHTWLVLSGIPMPGLIALSASHAQRSGSSLYWTILGIYSGITLAVSLIALLCHAIDEGWKWTTHEYRVNIYQLTQENINLRNIVSRQGSEIEQLTVKHLESV